MQKTVPQESKFSTKESRAINIAINELLASGAIKKCRPVRGQFISPIFLVPKPDGTNRLILNLKKLNLCLEPIHFKLEDKMAAMRLISQDCYMATVDLKQAYHLISISAVHRKYLRFKFKGKLYEFCCVPFGLCTAPWLFTKLMKPLVTFLRKKGFLSVVYLDDFLLLGSDFQSCANNVLETCRTLINLGFEVNIDKSSLLPKQTCTFLGFVFDSEHMQICIPQQKSQKLLLLLDVFLEKSVCTIRDFAKLLGSLVAVCPATKYGWLHTKSLERAKFVALLKSKGDYNAKMNIPPSVKTDLGWWKRKISSASVSLIRPPFIKEIFSDASRSGWGAVCSGQKTHGFWNIQEQELHINALELKAAFFALKCFASELSEASVMLRIDNTTAMSYINRMGGVKFPVLNSLANSIWQWCEQRNITVFASYISSFDNVEADRESRKLPDDTEWELAQFAYRKVLETFSTPAIDLFATRVAVDAFTLNWNSIVFYAFSPFNLILRVLKKIRDEKAEGILVVPHWPAQPWFPLFSSLLIKDFLVFEADQNLLFSPSRQPHPLWRNLSLVAGHLSGKVSS